MDQATLARACEPFFTTKGVGGGSGLGLPMVDGFARQSGAELRVQSWPGIGTRVAIWLPRAELPENAVVSADASRCHTAELAMPRKVRGSGRVLLVDDDIAVRKLVATVLGEAGYEIVPTDTGEDALAVLYSGQHFDALVTDYAMPGITGGELVRRARQLKPHLPALVVAGYAKAAQLGQVPGNIGILHKPFRADKLTCSVADLIAAATAAETLNL